MELFRERQAFKMLGGEVSWLRAEFLCDLRGTKGALAEAFAKDKDGLTYDGRLCFVVSTAKGGYDHGAVAWMSSPPMACGAEFLEATVGFGATAQL